MIIHMSSTFGGDTMVPNIEHDSILLLGYSILYKKYNLTRFNHQKMILREVGRASKRNTRTKG